MEETVDGEYQNFKANDGAFVRKNFFGKDPKLLEMVSRMSDDDIWRLNRGGHDPHKICRLRSGDQAHRSADRDPGEDRQGLRDGQGRRGQESDAPVEKLDDTAIREFRDRFAIPLPDDKLETCRSSSRQRIRRR